EVGIPGRALMESAGRAVVRMMEQARPDLESCSIAVICGKGNNGGDGLVVFRHLAARGFSARAWVLWPFESLSGDARDNLKAALKLGLPVRSAPTPSAWEKEMAEIAEADVVVDAIFGTGLTAAVRGLPEQAIRDINRISAFKVAVDVPSGLSSDSAEVPGEAVEADLTVALAAPKVCHVLPPACLRSGRLEIVDIGIARRIVEAAGSRLETIEGKSLRGLWPPRGPDAHKGDFGHLLIVAGSVGKTGAAAMAAQAALRAGTGLVTVASARSALPLMAPALPEAMWEPLDETPEGAIAARALPRAADLLAGKTAMALGPGLGRHTETAVFVKQLLDRCSLPVVVDADGVNAFEAGLESLPRGRPLALTPHPGEAARLLGCSAAEIGRQRLAAVRRLCAATKNFVALKGYRTLVGEPSGKVHVNLTGNPGMASGGTGDVLTGIVGGLLAQGLPVGDALRLGVHLHGLAGDLAAEEVGQTALVATDLICQLPHAQSRLGAP
ncbi:MAG: NAD(P)H-hydrate dehydratase, partial [Acidobacteriota bacterium]